MQSTNYAYVNGRFVPENEATVSIFDRGFLYGDGVFETMRIYGGKIFRLIDHLYRLSKGVRRLAIEKALTDEELNAVCRVMVERNSIRDGVVRVYVTRDSAVVTARAGVQRPVELSAIVSSVQVNDQLSAYKTANRLPYLLAQGEAQKAAANDAVLLNAAGHVVELTASNIFVVKDGELVTPPLSDGPLPGITRSVVLDLAVEQSLRTHERSFAPEFLDVADEVFATNSVMEVAPVITWSRTNTVTSRLAKAYCELIAKELSTPGP